MRPTDFTNLVLPRPIVLVNGTFDMLHASHMRLLFSAREHAKTLVCALDSDTRVRQRKGSTRPVMSWIERATALNYMPLDFLCEWTTDQDFSDLLIALKPDLRVQGYDYLDKPSTHPEIPKLFIRDGGVRTSTIVDRILNSTIATTTTL
jgi:cytidyltransferase-like protein